jgi:predicted dehydrogenase
MRFGIVGGGFGVDGYLAAIASLPDAKVTRIADSGSGRVLARLSDASIYRSSWRDLLAPSVDAICIVVPPAEHLEMVLEFANSGKHILCEKPFGKDLVQSRKMADAVKKKNLVAAVAYQYRFEPGLQVLKKLLSEQQIGNLQSVKCVWLTSGRHDPSAPWTWRNDIDKGGGVIGAFLSHVVDLLHWLTDEQVKELMASTKILVPKRTRGDGEILEVTAEDLVRAHLELTSGVRVDCLVSNCYPKTIGMRIEMIGSAGKLVYTHKPPFTADMQQIHLCYSGEKSKLIFKAKDFFMSSSGDTRLPAIRGLLHSFIQMIKGNAVSDLPTFEDGFVVQKVLHSVRKSALCCGRVRC